MASNSLYGDEAALQSIIRAYMETVSLEERPRALSEMLMDDDIDKTLQAKRDWRYDDYGKVWRLWRDIKQDMSEKEASRLWSKRWKVVAPLFDEYLTELLTKRVNEAREGFYLSQPAEIQELRRKVQNFESSIPSQPRRLVNRAYLVTLLAIIAILGVAVWRGWSQRPEVTVDFNVGEIIGGILVGAGALTAGTAYALRSVGRREQ
ncbi:MAG: hypothetical protein JWM21_4497 [Acidobacteria bacterium]|nr:hypothetical protein [Acidobacteriota bacterium]